MRQHFLGASGNKKKMKTLIEKIKQEIVYAKERMLDFDESNQKSNSDVELGVARGLNMALDIIKTQDPHKPSEEDLKALDAEEERFNTQYEEGEEGGHVEDLETHKEELRREREENL